MKTRAWRRNWFLRNTEISFPIWRRDWRRSRNNTTTDLQFLLFPGPVHRTAHLDRLLSGGLQDQKLHPRQRSITMQQSHRCSHPTHEDHQENMFLLFRGQSRFEILHWETYPSLHDLPKDGNCQPMNPNPQSLRCQSPLPQDSTPKQLWSVSPTPCAQKRL